MREDTQPDLKDMLPLVIESLRDGVLTMILNRPDKLNSLDYDMVVALHDALDRYWDEPDVRAVVINGAGGRAFVAGADIAELRERRREDALRGINAELFDRIARFPSPTIAAVRGWALGGGCELAVACDLRVVGESARFGQPETGLGIMAAAGATWRLPQLIGMGRTRELLFTGRMVEAPEALAIGLANVVVPDDEVLTEALDLARTIASNDQLAVRLTKLALAQVAGNPTALQAFESTAQAVLFESPQKFKRMDEFLERRKRRGKTTGDQGVGRGGG